MKQIIKILIAVMIGSFVISGCGKSDADKDYGFPLIYIPQATVTGLDNSYPIPNGPIGQNSAYSCRYNESTGMLEICLGVIRSGYISDAKGFSVELVVSQELTDSKLAEYATKSVPAQALPLDCCTIPGVITVPAGKNGSTIYLGVDLRKLAELPLYESGAYKILVLGLQLANPTAYELAEENTSVAVVLDLNSQYWNDVAENLPESAIRDIFPIY